MSSPSLRSPLWLRVAGVLLVLGAVAFKLGWHPALAPNGPAAIGAQTGAPVAASAPVGASHGFGPGVGFRTRERLTEHFRKHGREFHAASAQEYLRLAQSLRDRPAGGEVLEMIREDGVSCRFDRVTGAFLAFNRDGTLRTFFRPQDGRRYFERQAQRPPGAP